MQIPANIKELELALSEKYPTELILSKLKQQLNFDFSKAGFQLNLDEHTSPVGIVTEVRTILNTLPSNSLQQLLYLIDLPEKVYILTLNLNDHHQKLAESIVYREFVKVYYKLQFSS